MSTRFRVATICLTLLAAATVGCEASGAVVTEPPSGQPVTTSSATPPASASLAVQPSLNPGRLTAISASAPSKEAAAAFSACHIGDQVPMAKVVGMAQLASASELPHYVALSGREPQLKALGPVWVIQIRGDVFEPGGEVWTDPTCVVTTTDAGYFATGLITRPTTGETFKPQPPASPPDAVLPPLAP